MPVILNLQNADQELSKRLIDFTSGLTYALNGGMQRVADKVFLLTPRNVEVSRGGTRPRARARRLLQPGVGNRARPRQANAAPWSVAAAANVVLLADAVTTRRASSHVFVASTSLADLRVHPTCRGSGCRTRSTALQRFLYDVCEPYLRLFRAILPPLGPLDLSPMVADSALSRASADRQTCSSTGCTREEDTWLLTPSRSATSRSGAALFGYRRAASTRCSPRSPTASRTVWRERADLTDKVERARAGARPHRELEKLLRTTLVSAERASARGQRPGQARGGDDPRRGSSPRRGRSRDEARREREQLLVDARRIRSLLDARALDAVGDADNEEPEPGAEGLQAA